MPERYLGKTLGRYRVDAVAGSGGFAWVYRGYDPELEIPVALKVLKPQYSGDAQFEERFRREASTAAKLRHPNIIKIYSVGREGEAVYFAMDYLPNGLSDRLEVMGTLPEPILLRMAMDVASALDFAHRQGVIHRDVKTDNILFDDHGNAIVADFGIARAVSGYTGHTATNMVVGTPQYFSPEQARGQKLDGRADIYSLGVTVFRAATGSLPFSGDDWYDIARQQVEEAPPKPRVVNPAVSRGLEVVILKCLEKKADNRYQTGDELCQELASLLAERGESPTHRGRALPPGDTVRTPAFAESRLDARTPSGRRTRGRRALLIGAGAGTLLVGALVLAARTAAPPLAATVDSTAAAVAFPPDSGLPAVRTKGSSPSPARAAASRPRLVVRAPVEALISVNGVRVGAGTWTTDSLRSGRYEVAAALKPAPGCATTTARQTVVLRDSGMRELRLNPRGCGEITIDVRPAGATFTLSSLSDQKSISGTAPLKQPLRLPAGPYRLVVEARYCASYRHDFRVGSDRRNEPIRVRLICE